MSKFRMSLAVLPLVLGCAAASIASTNDVAPAGCEIRAYDVAGGVRIESVVYGAPGSAGSYQLSLVRSGSGGTSNVSQGGDYEIDDAGEAVVSVTEFNRGARDRYSVEMTVEDAYGVTYCDRGSL
ncbi:MAG: hypothetical protein KF769_08445 [Parvibaculum sp.]|uniref:curli-like amyloid fiber formation chaperone CsgH n=1 Tax=Parvibaculum sp. TaxID=2024848 RepID=UPI001DEE158B|nr:curli-like amyloid fiber formation chaperone CsgH [Parvibaculum sp.]MBX3490628.1 hypothetical protein [Parvibaculum sp.]MBX3496256.1 hypothetical protein [Parvibaculum sp.]MCW5728532.1 hypothetical protein [Parvibaculum sp.]